MPVSLTYPESLKNVIVSSASDLVIFKMSCKFFTLSLPVAASSVVTYAASFENISMSSSVCALFTCLSNKALPCESIGFCLTLSRCADSGPIEDSSSSIVTSALGSVVPVLWRSCAILNASSLGRSAKGTGLNGVLVSLAACVGSACSLATLLSTAVWTICLPSFSLKGSACCTGSCCGPSSWPFTTVWAFIPFSSW